MTGIESVITCPACSHTHTEKIPEDCCLYFYKCLGCSLVMRPRPGDCCVFCSFGTVKCPYECGQTG